VIRRYGLVSDTHGHVHRRLLEALADVEMILHAGDVGDEQVMHELGLVASVVAVAGNVDGPELHLPATRIVDLPFGRAALAHGHRFSADHARRADELRSHFAADKPRLILYGHSHLQHYEVRGGVHLVNPGSAGRPRLGTYASFGILSWDSDRDLLSLTLEALDWRRP
jgi:putative phosphoesterase